MVQVQDCAKVHNCQYYIGDIITLNDLFYAIMLPSGNDAAYCMAETVGMLMHEESIRYVDV